MIVAIAPGAAHAAPPPTDRTVEVNGAAIHIRCGGDRTPGAHLVLLEAGAGNGADTWATVQAPIAALARVCAYDRPWLVRGDGPRPDTPTPDAVVATLDRLLAASAERPPYILVGHSYGGMIVRLFASRFPDRVRGMILIDSSHEDQQRRFAALDPSGAPPPATRFEAFDLAATSRALAADAWRSTMPLIVLTRTAPPADAARSAPSGPTPAASYAVWLDLQRELATRSPRGEHIIAAHSGHYIQNDEPQLVIDAVRRVLAEAAR